MKTVIVTWQTENRVMPIGTKPAHHFKVGLALTEVDVPLSENVHTFTDVEPGLMSGFVSVCAEDGTELATPITYSVEVPQDVIAPIPVSVTGAVQ